MTDIRLLPNTPITSMVINQDVYSYVQTMSGDVYEIKGVMRNGNQFALEKTKGGYVVERSDGTAPDGPKLFTPLAATSTTTASPATRIVFYVDNNNILRDIQTTSRDWTQGQLNTLKIEVAPYSRLAAITVLDRAGHQILCVYYQAPTADAAVRMVSFGIDHKWTQGSPYLRDPPLYGTSLAAVRPRDGILVGSTAGSDDALQPVYYLQMDSLQLGHAQGTSDPVVMSGLELDNKSMVFSPHTSITAVDNGHELYIIYKSNNANIKVVEVVGGSPKAPTKLDAIDTTPVSAIAACLPSGSGTNVVLFYQTLDQVTRLVNLSARVLTKSGTGWNLGASIRVGG